MDHERRSKPSRQKRELKKKKHEREGVRSYKEVSLEVKLSTKRAMKTKIDNKCEEIENSLQNNSSKNAFQTAKDLTKTKQSGTTNIQNKDRKCLTEKQHILERWTYSHKG
ncbi:hypothetical protein PoB_000598900 [Plakobranchus ocellatus]|uniref:Uncharacterized protein n=1 Tax=Plakobranchus ocellatus TaxID=259542 RepID=A0AAV3Y966_9GAST|nr:hypothetical protein PoB_000598900 [Plakobranchus ocellatus]